MEMPDGSNYLDWYFQNMVWDFGGNYSKEWTPTFTDPKTVEAGTYLQDFAKAGYLKFYKDPAADFTAGIVGLQHDVDRVARRRHQGRRSSRSGTAFLPGDGNCPTGGAGVGIPAEHLGRAQEERAEVHRVPHQRRRTP